MIVIKPPSTQARAVALPTPDDPCPMRATREKTTTMDPMMDVTSVTKEMAK